MDIKKAIRWFLGSGIGCAVLGFVLFYLLMRKSATEYDHDLTEIEAFLMLLFFLLLSFAFLVAGVSIWVFSRK